MKYQQIILIAVAFFFAIQLTLATAYAQVASSSSSQMSPTVDYQLPYPGLLPDNPLYFLKMFRDNLTSFFLSKPLDKAQFDLMQSDKNVEASYLLVTQQAGKTDLAFKTFSQGQDEFAQAIEQTIAAKKQGYSITEMNKKLDLSNQKHEQILHLIDQQTGQNSSQTFQIEHSRIETFTKEIKALH
jgi:hypothetical protein